MEGNNWRSDCSNSLLIKGLSSLPFSAQGKDTPRVSVKNQGSRDTENSTGPDGKVLSALGSCRLQIWHIFCVQSRIKGALYSMNQLIQLEQGKVQKPFSTRN